MTLVCLPTREYRIEARKARTDSAKPDSGFLRT